MEMIDQIEKYISEIKNISLRSSIKTRILTDLDFILRFLKTSPGIISPVKAEDKIYSVITNLKNPWCSKSIHPKTIESLESVLQDIKKSYIQFEEKSDKKTDDTLLDPVADVIDSGTVIDTLPRRLSRLLVGVEIKKGDVALLPVGPCNHYCIVYKILGDITYVVPMTTTPGVFTGYPLEKSRFFRGMAIFSIHQFPTSMVSSRLTMPYDNKSECNNIFRALEDTLRGVLPRVKKKTKK